jgi:hypothetical protein
LELEKLSRDRKFALLQDSPGPNRHVEFSSWVPGFAYDPSGQTSAYAKMRRKMDHAKNSTAQEKTPKKGKKGFAKNKTESEKRNARAVHHPQKKATQARPEQNATPNATRPTFEHAGNERSAPTNSQAHNRKIQYRPNKTFPNVACRTVLVPCEIKCLPSMAKE